MVEVVNPSDASLKCSVVVPTYGRPAALATCLEAVAAQRHRPHEVIVVDNKPGDPRVGELAGKWGATYMVAAVLGLSRARNLGAKTATGDIVGYVDDDGVPDADWLACLAAEFRDPRVMATAGRTVPIALDTDAARLSMVVGGPCFNLPTRLSVDRETESWFEICAFGGVGGGGNMAIRRSAFEFWEGFHERTGRGTAVHGGEEQYAFLRLVDMGYRVIYTPRAVVHHPTPGTMEALRRAHIRDLGASTAYITLLFAEQPQHRLRTLRYLMGSARGESRPWRGQTTAGRPEIVPRWRKYAAMASGPARYAYGRLSRPTTKT